MEIQERVRMYFESKAVSNSLLSSLQNPRFVRLQQLGLIEGEDKQHFRIGSAVDCALTTPTIFNDCYRITNSSKPTGLLGKFVENLPPGLHVDSPLEMYEEAYKKAGYKKELTWVIGYFWSAADVVSFYKEMHTGDDRILLSKDEYETINSARDLILANEFTYPYFFVVKEDVDLYHQVPIYFTYKKTQCKSLLDGYKIDHVTKEIQPFDLKTTSKDIYSFPESFINYGYFRQCAFYELALKSHSSPVKHLLDNGYKLMDYIFIVVSVKKGNVHPALIYKTTPLDRKVGIEGGTYMGRKLKGIDQLMDDYNWHVKENYWDLPKDIVDSQGILELNLFA